MNNPEALEALKDLHSDQVYYIKLWGEPENLLPGLQHSAAVKARARKHALEHAIDLVMTDMQRKGEPIPE